jgi:hypothetical protein
MFKRRQQRSVLTAIGTADEGERRLLDRAFADVPVAPPGPRFVTLDEALELLGAGVKPGGERDKERRRILRAIREGRIRISAAGVWALGPRNNKTAAAAWRRGWIRACVLKHLETDPDLEPAEIVRKLQLSGVKSPSSTTIRRWIAESRR